MQTALKRQRVLEYLKEKEKVNPVTTESNTRKNMKEELPERGILAVALYDFPGIREDNLPFRKGEIITIIDMDESGWWRGSNVEQKVGIFPYNYVASLEDLKVEGFKIVQALVDYTAKNDKELSFQKGTKITIVRPVDDDWGWGRIFSFPGEEERLKERIVGLFRFVDVRDTERVDDLGPEEESILAELEEEKKRQVAVKKQTERTEVEEKTSKLKRNVEEAKASGNQERETLRRENEALQDQLKRMEELLAAKELEAEEAEQKREAAAVEAARLKLEKERLNKPEQSYERAKLVHSKAERSFKNNRTEDGFAAPKPRRKKVKVPARFAKFGKGGEKCKACGKSVAIGPFGFKAIGSTWHKECFKCGVCDKVLRGDYLEHDNWPYCPKCHKNSFGIKGFGFGGAVAGNYTKNKKGN